MIVQPNDILSGKGRSKDFHQGNIAFRNIVMKYKLYYNSKAASNEEKCHYAAMVISEVKAQDPPGRFLRCKSDDEWCEVDDASVIKKVRQALREDGPSIRRRTSNNKKNLAFGDDFIMEPSPPQGKRSYKRRKTSQDSDCRKDDLHKCPHDLLIGATVVKETEQESAEELKTDEDLQTTPKKIVVRNRVSTSTRRARWSQFAALLEDRDIDRQCQQAVPPKRSLSSCLVSSFQEKGEEVVLQPFFWSSNKNDMHEEEGIFFDDHEDISPLPVTTIVEEDEDYLELMDEIIMLGH